jgi:hypothetical protein
MKQLSNTRKFIGLIVMVLMLGVAVPTTSLAKDKHGRWRNRDNRDNWSWSRRNRKCGKFVNCHDARDGRWDGRGPRGDRVSNSWRFRNRRNNDFFGNRRIRGFDNNRNWRGRNR